MQPQCDRYFESETVSRRLATADTHRKTEGWHRREIDCGEHSFCKESTQSIYVISGDAELLIDGSTELLLQTGDFITIEAGAEVTGRVNNILEVRYLLHDEFESANRRIAQVYWES